MAPISLKKGIIDVLASDLVKHLLHVQKGDENFKIATEYVMSNFRFHRFLDVNPLNVSRSLKGLSSKFQVNSQDKKAQYLEEQVENFVTLPLLEVKKEDREVQTDAHYALLSFLLNLSNNPLNTEFSPKGESIPDTGEAVFDWTKDLLWGERPLSLGIDMDEGTEQDLYDSDNEMWILSEDEEPIEEEEEQHLYDEVAEIQQKLVAKVSRTSKELELVWLQENVVQSYWLDNDKNYMAIHNETIYSFGNDVMCKNWEIFQKEESKKQLWPKYQMLTEKQLVRETIWMLHGIENLHVYKYENGLYDVNDDVIVSHLSKETMKSLLSSFTTVGNKVMLLKQFAEKRTDGGGSISKTIQVFQYTVARFLMERKRDLAALEKTLIDREESVTLLGLKEKLHNDFTKVAFIHQLFVDAVLKGHAMFSTVTERVVYFLDVFYKTLCRLDGMGDAGLQKVLIILPYFLDICQPYLRDLNRWMTMGQLPLKSDEEFMIYKAQNVSKSESSYWFQTFKIKESRRKDGSTGKLIPEFIKSFQKQIVLSGKSLGLLAEFGEFATSVLSTKSIHEEFKRALKKTIREANSSFLKGEHLPIGEYEVDGVVSFVKDQNIDPLIRENFQKIFLDIYHHLKPSQKCKQSNDSNEQQNEWKELLKDGSCRPPMKLLIQQSLSPVVLNRYDKVCAVLLTLFKKEVNLFDHLDVMKNFFLMQAAGTMHSFFSEIFDKAKRKAFWQDMPYLNIVLQDALQLNYPELMGRLTVKFHVTENTSHTNAHLFDGLSLQYQAPWPVSIILDKATEETYNEIFKFLLKVKRSIWVLEQLRFFELISDVSVHDGSSDDDEPVRRACKRKDMELPAHLQELKARMLVLRMKMLHTIRSFQFYLMTRIEDGIQNGFQKDMELSRDLDEMLECHQTFIQLLKQKCFLHEKVGRSKEAILRTVTLAFDFEELWMKSIHVIDVKRLNGIEKDYGRCTSFLHSFFSTLAKRGSFPQFEFLANAMKVDSHQRLFRR